MRIDASILEDIEGALSGGINAISDVNSLIASFDGPDRVHLFKSLCIDHVEMYIDRLPLSDASRGSYRAELMLLKMCFQSVGWGTYSPSPLYFDEKMQRACDKGDVPVETISLAFKQLCIILLF